MFNIKDRGNKMINVMFVCLGNICRSPMAEFVFKDYVKKMGKESEFYIESSGTSNEEFGNPVHYGTVRKLNDEGIRMTDRTARKLTKEDYEKFDYILGMEERNVYSIYGIVGNDREGKVSRLLDYSTKPRDIADPWYTGNFDKTYTDIVEGVEAFYEYLVDNKLV